MADPASALLLKEARTRAGLTQRQLAKRSQTAQSVVARIEGGDTSPTWTTLSRLLKSAGFELHTRLAVRPITGSHPLDDVARILRLSPEDRLIELRNASRLLTGARRV